MVDDDSDYELMPKKEVDKLKKELNNLKRNPYGESDRGMDLQKSIERLNNTMNKLIAILEDAQQDIIDEYQDSKPLEKLNQILDQNETIAKAIVSMHQKIGSQDSEEATPISNQVTPAANQLPIPDTGPIIVQRPQIPRPQPDNPWQQQMPPMPQFNPQQFNPQQFNSQQQFQQQPQQFNKQQYPPQQQQFQQRPQQMNQQQFQGQQMNQAPGFNPLPPLGGIDDLPPLEGLDTEQMNSGMLPAQKKKKFLGII